MNVKKTVFSALLCTISLTLFVIEGMFPPLPFIGARIGIAYLPILFVFFIGGVWKIRDAVLILLVRILLSGIIQGNMMGMLFSLGGGVLAAVVMGLFSRFFKKDSVAVIIAGVFSALAHNVGQLMVAVVFYSPSVLVYIFHLGIIAIISGAVIGTAVYFLLKEKNKIIHKIRYCDKNY